MQNTELSCPQCGKAMKIVARGQGNRVWGCINCSGDPRNPVLYFQPVTALMAVRKLEQGPLIDLNFNPKTPLKS